MGKVIILEGPDGGGKTTLAKKLVEAGFEYRHEGPPRSEVDLVAHYLKILNDSLTSNKNVVHDRLWLGERIYGPVARGKDRLGDQGQKLFERLHRSKNIQQYICLPNFVVAQANYLRKIKEQNDYLKSMMNWEQVFENYAQWLYDYKTMGKLYDYSRQSMDEIVSECKSFTNSLSILPEGTIGSPTAKYLFIGDRPNHLTMDVPFFALNGSSRYLNETIQMVGIKEEDLALSNAFSPTRGPHSVGSILNKLSNLEHIFLLGNTARDWFYEAKWPTVAKVHNIYHPSYLKRFRGHDPSVMAEMIKKELNG